MSAIDTVSPRLSSELFLNLQGCLQAGKNKTRTEWTVEQLQVQEHHHILEIGYGNGNTLQGVLKKLKVGFLAGIDESVDMYQAAHRKNRKAIREQLLQLHVGQISQLPYPPQYFNTIYGNNINLLWKEPQYVFMQLSSLLKSGGKLVMVFQQRGAKTERQTWQAAESVQQQYMEAGLSDVRISFRDMQPVNAIAVVGYKE